MNLEQLFSLRSALLVSGLILLVTFLYPLSGDNALYMYMADLLLKGHLPYLGSWDHNYPGIVFIHGLHVALFGSSISGFHFFDSILQLANAWLLYKLVTRLNAPKEAAWLAAVGATLYYVGGGLALYGERDCYLATCIIGAAYYMLRGGPRDHVASALMLGLGVVLRPTALAYIGASTLWLLYATHRLKVVGVHALVSLIPIVLVFLVYGLLGGLDKFFEATFTYNVDLYARPGVGISDLVVLSRHWFILIGALIGLYSLWIEDRGSTALVTLLFLASIVSLIPVYRFDYHFHPMMTIAFALGGIGWIWIAYQVRRVAVHRGVRIAIVATILVIITMRYVTLGQPMLGLKGMINNNDASLANSYAAFLPSTEWGYRVQDSIARYLQEQEASKVQSLTSTMYPLHAADVVPANRFTNLFNLSLRSQRTAQLTSMQVEWREEYMSDMTNNIPEFIVGSRLLPDHVFNNGYMPSDVVGNFPELQSFINSKYDSVRQFGGYTIYRRKAEREP